MGQIKKRSRIPRNCFALRKTLQEDIKYLHEKLGARTHVLGVSSKQLVTPAPSLGTLLEGTSHVFSVWERRLLWGKYIEKELKEKPGTRSRPESILGPESELRARPRSKL
ncbi:hypothetical protein EVAR_83068_1 [Eumeta japonica]|uniref:Uncharacterized protein n=1 Tax=Eumeta variegata TaxID=151549 RepID=A0A4C1VMQ2_EUMVA|nr:hypothetical protein EVAR_83068_1 [Eumeta japonica]